MFGYSIRALICLVLTQSASASESGPQLDSGKHVVRIQAVDAAGHPVQGALAGLGTASGDANFRETGWEFVDTAAISDEAGMVLLKLNPQQMVGAALTVWHREKQLIAIGSLAKVRSAEQLTVTLHPQCHVTGTMHCPQLDSVGKTLQNVTAIVRSEGRLVAEYWSRMPNFEFFLPPGTYQLELSTAGEETTSVSQTLVVPKGIDRLQLTPVNVAASPLTLLIGEKAPDLREVAFWKNNSSVRLADLRGKVVLLDFWGWWCGACLSGMPRLFELHDQYHAHGLEIISVHVDADADHPVKTMDELNRRLATVRESKWKGREIPFAVAAMTPKLQPHGGSDAMRNALCATAADYGIEHYPSLVLIDRQGRVVGRVTHANCREKVEAELKRME